MTTKTKSGWGRFFTLKTEATLREDARVAAGVKRVLDTPHGLRSFIGDQQKAVDTMQAKTDAFLADIEAHFGDAAKYLTPAYTGRTKYENVEDGYKRRIGIQWVERLYINNDIFLTTISFVYTETPNGVRVDYILKRLSGAKDVINDNYNPDNDEIYKVQNNNDELFRAVRRYENHDEFVDSGHKPPKWFVDALSVRNPAATRDPVAT